jgi:hypothetical protein
LKNQLETVLGGIETLPVVFHITFSCSTSIVTMDTTEQ